MNIATHPCFSKEAHHHYGRMHLPVAPACNIQCGYYDRRYSCVNESRPGVTASVISPDEACELAVAAKRRMPYLTVAGIAGPGDPLANPAETLQTLELVRRALPAMLLCLSTNGLALPEYADDLAALGVSHLTVTVNAVDPAIGARIYKYVATPQRKADGMEGAALLLDQQLAGIAKAKKHGVALKINMVIVPGINDVHAGMVAERMARAGADLMNCIPMAPVQGAFLGDIAEPTTQMMRQVRSDTEKWLPQMRHCGRCRADAIGLLGQNHILTEMAGNHALKTCGSIKGAPV